MLCSEKSIDNIMINKIMIIILYCTFESHQKVDFKSPHHKKKILPYIGTNITRFTVWSFFNIDNIRSLCSNLKLTVLYVKWSFCFVLVPYLTIFRVYSWLCVQESFVAGCGVEEPYRVLGSKLVLALCRASTQPTALSFWPQEILCKISE